MCLHGSPQQREFSWSVGPSPSPAHPCRHTHTHHRLRSDRHFLDKSAISWFGDVKAFSAYCPLMVCSCLREAAEPTRGCVCGQGVRDPHQAPTTLTSKPHSALDHRQLGTPAPVPSELVCPSSPTNTPSPTAEDATTTSTRTEARHHGEKQGHVEKLEHAHKLQVKDL